MRRIVLALGLLFVAADAGAQIIRRRGLLSEPTAFVSVGAALQSGFDVRDGATGSTWNFGDATQYTASLERVLSPNASLGLRGNMARVPLTVRGSTNGDADATVSQAFASLYLTSGGAFHSVLEGDVGATIYSNFQARPGSTAVLPSRADSDFSFALGYGFGYSFSPRFSIDFVQVLTTTRHQKDGLAAGEESSGRANSTRLIARFGLGQR